ncbi:MAG: hypothetical protein HOM82_00580 [Thaumarchaeota archaeon]|jgi:hypothetical protein|nr:hypothetical protein [Nitrososphaerota archaeon]MBT3743414.1 hypothetical protein [Nitrososphaerota archaeon]MBT4175279.1 hypothetical protein [Nitrososphaerota archaeon]MBT4509752.1 hypothetical protein [Nitrososphaerota archaeon]MBT4675888.1 hypothetical protein [Nitrososphaerota archaeon]
MNPLQKISQSFENGIIPEPTYKLIQKRFSLVTNGIKRIEKASSIKYPIVYIEPSIIISGTTNSLDIGILYARTIPLIIDNSIHVVIQVSAPLVAYGLKGTIHAILAHEFLHYLELITRLSNNELISDEISSNLFENIYSDNTRLLEPRSVFNDNTLISHITKKFPSGFRDHKLEDKVLKLWIEKKLPVSKISLDTNTVKLNATKLSNIKLNELLLQQLEIIKTKNSKLRKKKLY